MPLETDKFSRGKRVQMIQKDAGYEEDSAGFVELLNETARDLGLPEVWTGSRLSKVKGGGQDLSADDALVFAKVDPKQRGHTFPAFGVELKRGEDAWAVLAKAAKKSKSA